MQTQKLLYKFAAFSLIELLMGLIVISIALAAFAPIMNKRVSVQKTSLSNKLTNRCNLYGFDADCKLCYGANRCAICDKPCPDGILNVSTCRCN